MNRRRFSRLVSALLFASAAILTMPRPSSAIICTWTPLEITVKNDGLLQMRIANNAGIAKILKFCSLSSGSTGAISSEVCSTYYVSSLSAMAIDATIKVNLSDTVLQDIGWSNSCETIQGQANVSSAIISLTIESPN